MGYYEETEIFDRLVAIEVNDRGEVDVYNLMSDREVSDHIWICAIDHLVSEGVKFND